MAINYLPAEESDASEAIGLIRAEGRNGMPIPGDIRGENFSGQAFPDAKKLVSFGSDTPLQRPDQPAELASIHVQLAANDASYTARNISGAGGERG